MFPFHQKGECYKVEETKLYIEFLLSLTKSSLEAPFKIEWTPLYGTQKRTSYLANKYFIAGSEYNNTLVLEVGPNFQTILNLLVPSIEKYPYNWPLESQKMDLLGYDFSTDEDVTVIEVEPVAREEIWRKLKLVSPSLSIVSPYTEPIQVRGGHLTKFSLTLAKASPISLLSFQMQATLPVRLASLLYEADISGYSEAQRVDLALLQIEQSAEAITIQFGEAIFAKRLTFVMAQDNAKSNTYYLNQKGEDFTYSSDEKDQTTLETLLKKDGETKVYQTSEVYNDEQIKDWSSERRNAYLKWRALKLDSLRK